MSKPRLARASKLGSAACALLFLFATTAITSGAQTFTLLHSFDYTDGQYPYGALTQAIDGNLYGTTYTGGANAFGTIFKVTPTGTFTTLYNFCPQSGCEDGSYPTAGLIQATDGNLYGTTYYGGAHTDGTVYKITPEGTLTTLYSFCSRTNCVDGRNPQAGLIQGIDGNFYGTTYFGGATGEGAVFKITPSGKLATLYSFCSQSSCTDGKLPYAALVQSTDGDLYGTTVAGGSTNISECSAGCGTVFKITPGGVLTTIYIFCSLSNCSDGSEPFGGLVQGADGNFYGTTYAGGGVNSYGEVFKITPSGTLTTIFDLAPSVGSAPTAGLVQGTDGNFYGTTSHGGAGGGGAIIKITTGGALATLYSFCSPSNCPTGAFPQAGLVQATDGSLYGTTLEQGANGYGSVFSLSVGLGPFVETIPASGTTGTAVRVLGTNLTGATGVTFNGAAAAFNVVSASELTTTVPAGASSGRVRVATPKRMLTSNQPFQITP